MKRPDYLQVNKLILDNKYKIIEKIGAGQFGQVYLAEPQNQQNQEYVCVKVFPQSDYVQTTDYYIFLVREAKICSQLNHQNICKCLGFCEDKKFYYLIHEYCDKGNLFSKIREIGLSVPKSPFKILLEEDALFYMRQIISAFKYIHSFSQKQNKVIIHRDIKLENIFIKTGEKNQEEIIKIGDFGFAREFHKGLMLETQLGSPFNSAPEIFHSQKYDERADIYSLGVIFYQMLFGDYPFRESQPNQMNKILQSIKSNKLDLNKNGIEISKQMQHLLQNMITYNPKDRINFKQLFKHPFFKEYDYGTYDFSSKHGTVSSIDRSKYYQDEYKLKLQIIAENHKQIQQFLTWYLELDSAQVSYTSIKNLEKTQIDYDVYQKSKSFTINNYKYDIYFEPLVHNLINEQTSMEFREKHLFLILLDSLQDEEELLEKINVWIDYIEDKKSKFQTIKRIIFFSDSLYDENKVFKKQISDIAQQKCYKLEFINEKNDQHDVSKILKDMIGEYQQENQNPSKFQDYIKLGKNQNLIHQNKIESCTCC